MSCSTGHWHILLEKYVVTTQVMAYEPFPETPLSLWGIWQTSPGSCHLNIPEHSSWNCSRIQIPSQCWVTYTAAFPWKKNCFYTQSLSLPLQKLPCTWLTIIFGHNFHQNSSKMLPLCMFPNNHFYLGSYDLVQENIQKIYLHICPAKLLLWWTHLPHSAWHIGLKAKGLWCLAFIVDVTLSHCH